LKPLKNQKLNLGNIWMTKWTPMKKSKMISNLLTTEKKISIKKNENT